MDRSLLMETAAIAPPGLDGERPITGAAHRLHLVGIANGALPPSGLVARSAQERSRETA